MFFLGRICSIWKFPGQGSNPSHSCNLHHNHSGSLTHCTRPGIKPMPPQRQCQILNLLHHSSNSRNGFLKRCQLSSWNSCFMTCNGAPSNTFLLKSELAFHILKQHLGSSSWDPWVFLNLCILHLTVPLSHSDRNYSPPVDWKHLENKANVSPGGRTDKASHF